MRKRLRIYGGPRISQWYDYDIAPKTRCQGGMRRGKRKRRRYYKRLARAAAKREIAIALDLFELYRDSDIWADFMSLDVSA